MRQGSAPQWLVALPDPISAAHPALFPRLSFSPGTVEENRAWGEVVGGTMRDERRSRKRGTQASKQAGGKRKGFWETYPSSSNVMEILIPLGVCVVYSVMSDVSAMVAYRCLRCWNQWMLALAMLLVGRMIARRSLLGTGCALMQAGRGSRP